MNQKTIKNAIRITVCVFVILLLLTLPLKKLIDDLSRQKELSSKYAYEVFFTYVENRQTYYLYLMCNPKYTIETVIGNTFTDEYLNLLLSKVENADATPAQTIVFLMKPTEELPYGWEKSDLNIACNFDTSVFHRNTVCKIYIPYGSSDIENCIIDYG